jgi:hypothetical protein
MAEKEISPVEISTSIKQAFNFTPGYTARLTAPGRAPETFEVFTDALNQSYIHSRSTGATAYFINNGFSFYFTSFYGSRKSLLYYFYLSAYKIVFTDNQKILVTDTYPLQENGGKAIWWLLDLMAPFRQFMKLNYKSICHTEGRNEVIQSVQTREVFGKSKQTMTASVHISRNAISKIWVELKDTKIEVEWAVESIF